MVAMCWYLLLIMGCGDHAGVVVVTAAVLVLYCDVFVWWQRGCVRYDAGHGTRCAINFSSYQQMFL